MAENRFWRACRILVLSESYRMYDCIDFSVEYRILEEADLLLRTRLLLAILPALVASSCSLYRSYQASTPEAIRQTESMLSDAGFRTIKVDTSEQIGLAED